MAAIRKTFKEEGEYVLVVFHGPHLLLLGSLDMGHVCYMGKWAGGVASHTLPLHGEESQSVWKILAW